MPYRLNSAGYLHDYALRLHSTFHPTINKQDNTATRLHPQGYSVEGLY